MRVVEWSGTNAFQNVGPALDNNRLVLTHEHGYTIQNQGQSVVVEQDSSLMGAVLHSALMFTHRNTHTAAASTYIHDGGENNMSVVYSMASASTQVHYHTINLRQLFHYQVFPR